MTNQEAHQQILKNVQKARFRLNFFSFGHIWLRTLFYVLLFDCVLFGTLKLTLWTLPVWQTLAVSVCATLPLTWFWYRKVSKSVASASILIDRHLRLKEKISSALSLADDPIASDLEAEWRNAQLKDAVSAAKRLDLRKAFPWAAPAEYKWLWAPAFALLMIAYLIPQWQLFTNSAMPLAQATELDRKKIEKETDLLKQRQLTLEKRAQDQRMSVASDMAKEIKELATNLSKGKLEKREALSKISSLQKEWEKKKEDLLAMQQQNAKPMPMNRMKMTGELAKSLQAGDFKKAAEAMQELQKKLKMNGLSDEAKKRLAAEMKELANALDVNSPLMNAMEAASIELKDGDMEAALASMDISEMELADLDALLKSLEMMEQSLKDLEACKLGLLGKCKYCGQGDCDGSCMGTKPWRAGESDQFGNGMGGPGIGRGGKAPFEETDTQSIKSKVQGDFHAAPLSGMMKVPGAPYLGDSQAQFSDTGLESAQAREDAMVSEHVPVPYRNQVRAYFSLINQGGGASSQNNSEQ